MRNGQRIAVVAGVCAAVVSVVGFGAYSLLGGDDAEDGRSSSTDGEASAGPEAGPPSEDEVLDTSAAFLDAWAAGDTASAAALTDDPTAARAALDALVTDAAVSELAVEPGAPQGAEVPFAVDAVISYEEEAPAELSYDSALTVVRDGAGGEPRVAWAPSVLHPDLTKGQAIETGPVSEIPPVEVLDRNGAELSADDYPSLAPVLGELQERYGEEAGGTAGAETRIVDAEGETVTRLVELSEPTAGEVPTTIDPAIQQAAEDAVAGAEGAQASVVAIQPSTGAIQAIANRPADGFDTALEGSYAPGSTFKIVTASLLMDQGLASPGAGHPCPKFFEHGGWEFQNLDEFEIENGTFADSFAASCNTAFISQAPELSDDDLGDHARNAFGLGLAWQVGVTSMDGAVPTQSDAQMAASLIGQGAVRMNPLTMASVSATVKNGAFLQPYLVPADFDGRELAQAPEGLATAGDLRSLMNRTATSGTAAEAMSGLGGDIGAKTGSAEVDGQEKPNAWFTGYRNDLAVAAVVPDSGHGGSFAGPVVADVLRAAP
ncbi:penicillin-binding transpeptidase domain-containing protein [Streptomyces sp. SBT349]|uniref:penicillin-binding transpeptidase domain-containing protein n=1 Tax=Streptomyces sp. SBT349 TaxID=1580539 RepID=UPI000AC76A27|nr:penicillin-binding transpeptidase domain-containing protein [Streptomyces sp. SBT349]